MMQEEPDFAEMSVESIRRYLADKLSLGVEDEQTLPKVLEVSQALEADS